MKPLRDQHVKPKAAATFKCELYKETPNWKWLKGETEITPSDKIEIKKDGKELTLTIKNCQPEDVSDYTMEVEGRVYSAKLTLGGWSINPAICLSVALSLYLYIPSIYLSIYLSVCPSTNRGCVSEREAEILKPLSSMEVVEKDNVTFETEISEEDVPGEWKLKGVVLTRSPVPTI